MNMKSNRWIEKIRNTFAALLIVVATTSVFGNVINSNVVNPDGTVTYSYRVDNSAGSFDIAAWSLDFGFSIPDWNQADTFSGGGVNVPNAKWFADAGIPLTGQSAQDFLSLSSDGDVVVGQTLDGFSFTSKFLPGTITYHEFSAAGDSVSGTTVGPVGSVPEGSGPLEAIAFVSVMAFAARTGVSRDRTNFGTGS